MSDTKPLSRWYVVTEKKDGAACLVEAGNRAQAFRRAGEFYCTARPASVDEAIKMIREGADVIHAPNTPEQMDLEEQLSEQTGGATAPAKCDGNHGGPPCADPECWARTAPQTNKAGPTTRKASEVFGAGFGPRSAADGID